MVQTRIMYGVLFLLLILFYVFTSSYIAYVVWLFTILFTLLMAVYIFMFKDKIDATVLIQDIAQKNVQTPFILQLKNKSMLPMMHVTCKLHMWNKLTNERQVAVVETSLQSYEEKQVKVQIHSEYSGVVEIKVTEISCRDFLHLFHRKAEMNAKNTITFMPSFLAAPLEEVLATADSLEAASFTSTNKGNMEQEMIALKEYVPGDNVKHIHWKLSFKLDDLIVKELSDVTEEHIVLLLETSIQIENDVKRMETIDKMMDTYLSVMKQLVDTGKTIHLAWYDEEVGQLQREVIYTNDQIHRLLHTVLALPIGNFPTSTYEQYMQIEEDGALVFYVTTNEAKEQQSADEQMELVVIDANRFVERARKIEVDDEQLSEQIG